MKCDLFDKSALPGLTQRTTVQRNTEGTCVLVLTCECIISFCELLLTRYLVTGRELRFFCFQLNTLEQIFIFCKTYIAATKVCHYNVPRSIFSNNKTRCRGRVRLYAIYVYRLYQPTQIILLEVCIPVQAFIDTICVAMWSYITSFAFISGFADDGSLRSVKWRSSLFIMCIWVASQVKVWYKRFPSSHIFKKY